MRTLLVVLLLTLAVAAFAEELVLDPIEADAVRGAFVERARLDARLSELDADIAAAVSARSAANAAKTQAAAKLSGYKEDASKSQLAADATARAVSDRDGKTAEVAALDARVGVLVAAADAVIAQRAALDAKLQGYAAELAARAKLDGVVFFTTTAADVRLVTSK